MAINDLLAAQQAALIASAEVGVTDRAATIASHETRRDERQRVKTLSDFGINLTEDIQIPFGVTVEQVAGDPVTVSPVVFDIVFAEEVTGLLATHFTLTGTALRGTPVLTGEGDTYELTVPVTRGGTVIAALPSRRVQSEIGAWNTRATSVDATITVTGVTVTINEGATQDDPATASPVVFDIVFSRAVTGLIAADIVLTGTATRGLATLSGAGTTYDLSVVVTSDGSIIANLPAGVAADATGITNDAATTTDNTVTVNLP